MDVEKGLRLAAESGVHSRTLDFSCTPMRLDSAIRQAPYTQHTHHNGLSQLLIRAHLRQEDSHLNTRTALLCDGTSHTGSKATLDLNRETHQRRRNASTAHHKVQNQTPPFKPQCAPSASIS